MTGEAAGANALTAATRGKQPKLALSRAEGVTSPNRAPGRVGRLSQASANTNGQLIVCTLPCELKPGDR